MTKAPKKPVVPASDETRPWDEPPQWNDPYKPDPKVEARAKRLEKPMSAEAFARQLERETFEQFHKRKTKAKGEEPPPHPGPNGNGPKRRKDSPTAIDPTGRPLTESDMADAFLEFADDKYRYDQKQGCWFHWVGTHWQEDGTKVAFENIRQIGVTATAELPKAMKQVRKAGFARGVEAFARCDPRVSVMPDQWDVNPNLLGTPGGTVDLRTGVMRVANPKDLITKVTGVAPVKGKCSQWLEFLEEATGGDLDLIRFIKRWLGYSLTGHTREEQLAFFYGPGGNGKGTLLSTATRLIGDYAVTAPMAIFLSSQYERHSTDLAMLRGARFVTAQETKSGVQWDESRLKMLTGGDEITARFMRQDNFTFQPQFTLTMSANTAPTLEHVDDAIRRRFNIVPFLHKPAEMDTHLKERLIKEEGSQILAWMIEGAVEWHNEGLGKAEAVKAASEEYFGAQDTLGQWLDEECEREANSKEGVQKLYQAFTDYNRGDKRSTMSATAFSKDLVNNRGFTRSRDQYGALIVGIRLLSPTTNGSGRLF